MKNLIDLTRQELIDHGVWYLPGPSEEGDEFSILPADMEVLERGLPFIVRTTFISAEGRQYLGYVHHQAPYSVDALQPTVFVTDSFALRFWQGMFLPNDSELEIIRASLPPGFFPVSYASQVLLGRTELQGNLEGLYYFAEDRSVSVFRV